MKLFILRNIVTYSITDYVQKVILPIILLILVTFWPSLLIQSFMKEGILRLLIVGSVSVIVVALGIYFIVLNKSEKNLINSFLAKLITKGSKTK